jgi:hypothetical protein
LTAKFDLFNLKLVVIGKLLTSRDVSECIDDDFVDTIDLLNVGSAVRLMK